MPLENISCNKTAGGWHKQYTHRSEVLNCDMRFAIFLPPQTAAGQKVPVLYWLSGLTCTDENFMQNVFNRVNSYGLPIIAGGDFNMVQCTKKPTNPKRCVHPSKQKYSGINPELFNMATVPNP